MRFVVCLSSLLLPGVFRTHPHVLGLRVAVWPGTNPGLLGSRGQQVFVFEEVFERLRLPLFAGRHSELYQLARHVSAGVLDVSGLVH